MNKKYRCVVHLLIIFVILLTTTTCKKIREEWIKTRVKGTVVDYYNDNPITYAKVIIRGYKPDADNLTHYNDYKTEKILYTDSKGVFEYNFHAKMDYVYSISIEKTTECYHDYWWDRIDAGHKNNKTFKIVAGANVLIQINNINPFDENDLIRIYTTYDDNNNILPYWFKGDKINKSFIIGVCANTNIYVKKEVTKNNISTISYDTLFVSNCDTIEYYINY